MYVCIRLWTTPQPHSTQRPTLAPAKIKGSFASARSGSHRYVCNKRARCTRKAFSKVPKAFSKVWRLSFLLFGHRQWRPLSFHFISSHHFCGHRQWQPFYTHISFEFIASFLSGHPLWRLSLQYTRQDLLNASLCRAKAIQ